MTQPQSKMRVKAPQKPMIPVFGPNQFKKPSINIPKFNTSFRSQNRGSGGK